MKSQNFAALDIETNKGDFNDVNSFTTLFTGVMKSDKHMIFKNDKSGMTELNRLLENYEGTIVTFNGRKFDVPVLSKDMKQVINATLKLDNHVDLLYEIVKKVQHRISLANIGELNFEIKSKPHNHDNNENLWKENPKVLINKNNLDLEITTKLYRRVISGEPIKAGIDEIITFKKADF